MARKTKEEAAQTRARILETALDEFCERGFSRATLNDIAERAGFTRGAVYWHFKDKAEIFSALANEMHERSEAHLNVDWAKKPESLAEVASSFTAFLAYFEEDADYCRFYEMAYFNTEWADELRGVLDEFNTYEQQTLAWTEHALGSLRQQGLVKDAIDLRLAALTLTALATGLISSWLSNKESFSLKTDAHAAITLFMESLKP